MFLGAALRTSGSVLAERQGHTAIQLVLTPIPAREIAAAKILPHLAPFLWGILAAAPLYFWAGTSGAFHFDDSDSPPSPLALTPLRLLAVLRLDHSVLYADGRGIGTALVMLLSDLALIWAAAHWGAALAVRSRGPVGVVLGLLWCLTVAVAVGLGFWALSMIPAGIAAAALAQLELREWGTLLMTLLQASTLALLWWQWPMRNSVRQALAAFSTFDSLVDEEYRPPRRLGLTGWRWWETNWRR